MHGRFVRNDLPLGIVAIPAVAVWTPERARVSWNGGDLGLTIEANSSARLSEDCGHRDGLVRA